MDHDFTDSLINELFEDAREFYLEIEISPDGTVLYKPPPLDDVWLDKSERRAKRIELEKEQAYNRDRWKLNNEEIENENDLNFDSPLLTTNQSNQYFSTSSSQLSK